jgi:hypothetical protein
VRYEQTESFRADYRRLSEAERSAFLEAVRRFNEAADRIVTKQTTSWPRSLRVKSIRGAPGVLEMTWSFTGPDGRATWEWIAVADDDGRKHPAVRWRRIGDHAIFERP